MIEVRFHGRGGQGAVTSCELLSSAIIEEGRYAQGFASFGPERRGAPVLAFVRAGKEALKLREQVYHPDIVVVLDPTLLRIIDVTSGLKGNGWLILNTKKSREEIKAKIHPGIQLAVVDATTISRQILHVPIVSASILGALVRATAIVELKSLEKPMLRRFGALLARMNQEALMQTYWNTAIS
jgi:2-oxoacid:acceptor oxidoreductase gamma subunit (pyruvate/2-ketoisovalerate family)